MEVENKMRQKKVIKEAFHCDGYYFNGSCHFKGQTDVADANRRCLCTNYGLDKHDKLCRHCVENRKYYRTEPHMINGKVISLTPFQAKNSNAVTVRAFDKAKPLIEYLKQNKGLYGVNVQTGVVISTCCDYSVVKLETKKERGEI